MRAPQTAAGAGAMPLPGASGGCRRAVAVPSQLHLESAASHNEKRKAKVRLSCALRESRVAPAGKGETVPAGAAGRGRVLLHCCPAGEEAEEPSAKRGHSGASF